MKGLRLDSAIAAYLIDPAKSDYTVSDLLTRYTDFDFGADATDRGELDLDGTALTDAAEAGRNALAIAHMVDPLRRSLESQSMTSLHDDIENPLVRILARMEHVGIAVDRTTLSEIAERLSLEARELGETLQRIAGSAFNPNSPSQLGRILFDEKGLTPPKKTKTGYSTDAATLEKLRDEWPEFIDPLLRFREVDKLRGTYGEDFWRRWPPTAVSTRPSIRPWPAPGVCRVIAPTCTTFRCAPTKVGCFARRSFRIRAPA